jgi:hypothetical protein
MSTLIQSSNPIGGLNRLLSAQQGVNQRAGGDDEIVLLSKVCANLFDELGAGQGAAAGTLTGTTLAPNVVNSSLTSLGTLSALTVTAPITGSITGSAPAGTLSGATLASNVLASSLTSVGTLTALNVTGIGTFGGNVTSAGRLSDAGGTLAAQRNALAPAQGLELAGVGGSFPALSTPAAGLSPTTVAGWFRIPSFASAQSFLSTTTSQVFDFADAATMRFYSGASYSISTPIPVGVWFFATWVRNGDILTGYINGLPVGSVSGLSGISISAITRIGTIDGTNNMFIGGMRLLGIYNRALSAAEILALYQTGTPASADYYGAGVNTTITAGSFNVGKRYRIVSVGTTSFTSIGASANTIGIEFIATGAGTGNGTATALGLLVAPSPTQPGTGLIWYDTSGNGADITRPATSTSWLTPLAPTTPFNALALSSITAATSTTTGALVVGANVGLSGNSGGPSFLGGNLTVAGTATARHAAGSGAAPTAVAGPGAGTGGTITVTGTDRAGVITITTGTTPLLNAVIATMTFSLAYATAPNVVLQQASASASNLSGIPYVTTTTSTFVTNSATTPLTASTVYTYYYVIVQ